MENAIEKSPVLSLQEETELSSLETTIQKNLQSFYRVGAAIIQIRDSRLYRQGYATFEEYCKDRWDWSQNYAERLMLTTKVIESVKSLPMGRVPENERQARPLSKLDPDQQKEAWQQAVETAPGGKVTARHVGEIVKGFLGEKEKQKTKEIKKRISGEELISDEFKKVWDALFTIIKNEKALKWRTTSKDAAIKYIEILKDVITI